MKQPRLYKIFWKIPYANYETYVIGKNEEDAMRKFKEEIKKEVAEYHVEGITELLLNGVIVTRHVQ